jgi:AcrR family transcriptional regulator
MTNSTQVQPAASRLPAEQRREQILTSAIRVYEQRPHIDVGTAEIAASAGVARSLIHHYFGSGHGLYLEVLRRLYFIAPLDASLLEGDTLPERISRLLDRWLAGVARHRNTWMGFTTVGGPGADPDVAEVLAQADVLIATRVLEAAGVTEGERPSLLPLIISWGGMAKAAIRQWLVVNAMDQDQVRDLLVSTLLAILNRDESLEGAAATATTAPLNEGTLLRTPLIGGR